MYALFAPSSLFWLELLPPSPSFPSLILPNEFRREKEEKEMHSILRWVASQGVRREDQEFTGRERERGRGTLVIVLSFASSFRCSFFPFAAAVDDDIDGEEEDHVVLFQHVIHVPQFFSLGFPFLLWKKFFPFPTEETSWWSGLLLFG